MGLTSYVYFEELGEADRTGEFRPEEGVSSRPALRWKRLSLRILKTKFKNSETGLLYYTLRTVKRHEPSVNAPILYHTPEINLNLFSHTC